MVARHCGRTLGDGTTIAPLTPDERIMVALFLTDYMRHVAAGERFALSYEFKAGINPFPMIILAWLPLLEDYARQSGKALVWITPKETAIASNAFRSLLILNPPEILLWGDLATCQKESISASLLPFLSSKRWPTFA